jgi:heat shock protein HslJ
VGKAVVEIDDTLVHEFLLPEKRATIGPFGHVSSQTHAIVSERGWPQKRLRVGPNVGIRDGPHIIEDLRMFCDRVGRAFALGLALSVACLENVWAQEDFPFEREMLLDARPMKGSKRLPGLEVQPGGAAVIDLWCNSLQARITVNGDAITITAGEKTDRQCAPERAQADSELTDVLAQVSQWQWDGEDAVVLIGPKRLRFRLLTN